MTSIQQEIADTAAMLRGRAGTLRRCADRLDAEADALHGSGEVEEGVAVIRGRAIVEHLLDLTRIGDEYHYMELDSLLRSAGLLVGGKDSAATLLANLGRAKEFESVRPRSGLIRRVA